MLCLLINVESNGYSQEFSAQILTNLVDCYTMRIVNDDEFLCDGGPSLETLKLCFVTDNLGLVLTFDLSYRYTIYSQKPIELSCKSAYIGGWRDVLSLFYYSSLSCVLYNILLCCGTR